MLIQSQQPAPRTARDGNAQLQLIRRYSKLLRESASAARAAHPGQRPAARRSSSASRSASSG